MGDPVADIEVQLRRSVATQEQANAQRKALNDSFAGLNQDQAAALLSKLFTQKDALTLNFRRLHRAVRLELLLRLANKLGTQTSQNFRDALTGGGDTPEKQGLKVIFPEYTKAQRDKFLLSLGKAPASAVPTVVLEFRNKDHFSLDNEALAVKAAPDLLGPLPDTGINQMELRGIVTGHRHDAEYRFDRMIEQKTWYRVGSTWKPLHGPLKGRDNRHHNDEDDHPDNDHIYSIDTPGFTGPVAKPDLLGSVPRDDRATVDAAVFMMNATETVEISVAKRPFAAAASLDWCTVTWLEKAGGTWRRKADWNMIEAGTLNGLMDANSPDEVAFLPPP
ncbi:MAG TPA: hypothetical protein VKD43_04555 [Xanthobacteraceae bacterium]|nr:hypothetical protein [Xanthobacteraceae bacterium]